MEMKELCQSSGVPMLDNLFKLRNAWQQSEPKRATGGAYALEGFNYQFGVFLLRLLEKWINEYKNNEPISSPDVSFEYLSDFTYRSAEGLLFVTQVKLSSPASYDNIFDEFWKIFNLARRIMPGSESELRFVLCTSSEPVTDIQTNYKRWVKKKSLPSLLTSQHSSLISSRVEAEPHDRILGLLANFPLRDTKPVDHLYEWLGRILATSNRGDFDSAIRDIWQGFTTIVNSSELRKSSIYVWQTIDRPPKQISRGDYLTGEQPTPANLRDGCFAPRPDVYDGLYENYSKWQQTYHKAGECSLRLPIFWIGGRSGSGKSVALLHLLAQIHSQGETHILWIGQHIIRLPEAIQWATALREKDRKAIIAVDDPYAPATQDDAKVWNDAIASLESLRCEGGQGEMPIVVCCGPSEHAEKLNLAKPDYVKVNVVPLREEIQSDLDDLRSWYRQRTGDEPPDVGDDNVLLVQLFFQWRNNATLPGFAERFQKRINESDDGGKLHDVFSHVLAANRLYLGYPQAAFERSLPASLRDTVDRLKYEHHIADMSTGRDGVWLAHPHLSNAIYEYWYPSASKSHIRETHLTDLINDALQYGENPRDKAAPLWALSRSLGSPETTEPVVGRLDLQTISHVVPRIYQQRIEIAGGQLSASELPVWIQIRSSFPDILLQPDPIDLAINKLHPDNMADVGLRLTCHKLLQFRASMSVVQTTTFIGNLTALLKATINTWYEWPHIAADAYKRTGDETLETLLIEWVKSNARKLVAHRIILDLLHSEIQSGEIDVVAATILLQQSDDSMLWADIAKQLIIRCRSEGIVRSVCEWAALHSKEFRTGFLLAEMVRRRIPDAIRMAREWAQECHKEPSANWVLEALCEHSDRDPLVRDWCITWLKLDFSQSNPGFLAEKLIRVYPADSTVKQYIHQWLRKDSPTRPTWFYVWDAAYDTAPGDGQLITIGIDALKIVRPENKFWVSSWQKLFYSNRANKLLVDICYQWLRKMPKNRQIWITVWNMLWHATGGNRELFEIGLEWLNVNMRSKVWAGLWGRFWKLYHGDSRLIVVAKKWLFHNLWQWNVWFFVWDEIWKIDKEDDQVNQLAHAWLAKTRLDLPSWPGVWERVWSYDGPADDLRELGLKWLRNTQLDHGSWQRIWAALWNDRIGDKELQKMGQAWLDSVSMSDGSWPKMWKDLWPLDKANSILIKRGIEWISKESNFKHGDWQHNWKELVMVVGNEIELILIGQKWLKVMLRNHYWVDVWMFLSTRTPITSNMLDVAKKWLLQTQPNDKWPKLWVKIKEEGADTEALRKKAKEFVEKEFDHQAWFRLWASLRLQNGDNKAIDELGFRWLKLMLRKRPNTHTWHQVWSMLWKAGFERASLVDMAVQWIQRVSPEDTTWHNVWSSIYEAQPENQIIIKAGKSWLNNVKPRHQGWYQVWRPLFMKSNHDQDLLYMALTWFENTPITHPSWSECWLTAYAAIGGNERRASLESIALEWLRQSAATHKSNGWPTIWRMLWDGDKMRARLLPMGIEWLKANPYSTFWIEIYDPLCKSGEAQDALQKIKINDERR